MKYMLLIYGSEDSWTEQTRKECMLESLELVKELDAAGKWLDSAPLDSVNTATSIRVRDGKRQITDGPFAETTEQLGGFYILDVENLDEAIDIASRIPPATKGTVEIRPLLEIPASLQLPESSTSQEAALTMHGAKQYLVLMYAEADAWPPDSHAHALAESVTRCQELDRKSGYISASPLQPSSTATCVRVRGGERLVTDGPFPETKEQLGGYFLIAVSNLDEAIEFTALLPGTQRGSAEIRPLAPLPTSE